MYIGNRRECFFDDYTINVEKTTAKFLLHSPVIKEQVMKFDKPWEGDGSTSQSIVKDGDIYRLYYIGRKMKYENTADDPGYFHCYAESKDGINWVKPELGIFDFEGSTKNNILGCRRKGKFQHGPMSVFLDTNPECPYDKRIKALVSHDKHDGTGPSLWALCSDDGIRFDYDNPIFIEKGGYYDSMMGCFWDDRVKKYRLYVRGQHKPDDYDGPAIDCHDIRSYGVRVRDIRYLESEDFIKWGESTPILYADDDYNLAMYENKMISYYRAPHIQIGFPTRYIERKEWTPNYDELTDRENRRARFEREDRFGLAITDCTFIASHNGLKFKRFAEAFVRPGRENGKNWIYGDVGYPALGIIETAAAYPDVGKEISLYFPRNEWHDEPTELWRYTIRLDGFVSLHADGEREEVITTKPFVFEGDDLFINFETSARGYLYITLTADDGVALQSCETFGDSDDRRVRFENGKVSELRGKEVIMKITLRDADIYSFRFGKTV